MQNRKEDGSVNGPHPLCAAADAKDGPPGKSDAKGQAPRATKRRSEAKKFAANSQSMTTLIDQLALRAFVSARFTISSVLTK
jgi:hypothetical protein